MARRPDPTLARVRAASGLELRGTHMGRAVGWTTDQQAARRAAEAGAIVHYHTTRTEGFSGWEVSCPLYLPEPADAEA